MATVNLTGLFGQKVFRIPDYQRGYAWEEKQLNELWDDIDEICVNNEGELQKHYTGTIFLEKITSAHIDEKESWLSGHDFYHVVDGQQRLTTIIILLFELLKVEQNGYSQTKRQKLFEQFVAEENMTGSSKVYKFGYSDDKTNRFLLNQIFEDNSVVLGSDTLNSYAHNLVFAKKYFGDKISNLTTEQREELYQKITCALQFDERFIEKDLDVQSVFETMNNRGKPLTALEKLKNRLIYLSEKLIIPQEDKLHLRETINSGWGKIYSNLAQNPNNVLDEDEFLSAHLSLYRKPKEATFSERLAEKKVFEMFCNKSTHYSLSNDSNEKEPPVDYHKIHNYVVSLSDLAPLWYKINNSDNKMIRKLFLLNDNKEIKILVVALIHKEEKNSDIKIGEYLKNIEKVLFRNRVPGLWVMDERNLANFAREIYITKSDDALDSLDSLDSYINRHLSEGIDKQRLIDGVKYLFSYVNGNKGFHRWGTLKYLLFEYEDSLKEEYIETSDRITIDDFDQTTIEHILPQAFGTYWQDQMEQYLCGVSQEDIAQAQKILINTLGNLTLLKYGKNSSLGNQPWIGEDGRGKKERFSSGSYNELEVSKYDNWDKHSIEKRGRKILRFLEAKIDGMCLSETDIDNILFTDSVFYVTK